MTFREIERLLPNGFHDAELAGMRVDFRERLITLEMNLLIGAEGRSSYSPALIVASHLVAFSVEAPDRRYPFASARSPLTVTGDVSGEVPPEFEALLQAGVDRGSFYRFFVEEWNSFINIVATDVSIVWQGASPASPPRDSA